MYEFNYYIKKRHKFYFDKKGLSAKDAFYQFDTHGKLKPTKHPNILKAVLKAKGSLNLHVKISAEDRAKGYLPAINFSFKCFFI